MYQPLPTFPPLFPPGKWWRLFLKGLLAGMTSNEAVIYANNKGEIRSREWMRLILEGDTIISMPVKGGASTLKNKPSSSWTLASEAVRDGRKNVATLATLYGRQPFFSLLSDDLSVMADFFPGDPAAELCVRAFEKVKRILSLDDAVLLENLRDLLMSGDRKLEKVRKDFTPYFKAELSIMDPLVKLGPDAIFSLLPSF